jgi:hypothetical protein
MVKSRPILYATQMVQAIIANRKTKTRRTKGLEKINEKPLVNYRYDGYDSKNDIHFMEEIGIELYQTVKCPFGKVGDLLWVKETSCFVMIEHAHDLLEGQRERTQYVYRASIHDDWMIYASQKYSYRWTPSLFMPKAAARIWLEITDIKIERLKDISEEDAKAEGVEIIADGFKNYAKVPKIISTLKCFDKAYYSFLSLWESINGYESSELNPWVWVITFKKIEK